MLTVTLLLKIQIILFIVNELFMIILTVTLLFKYRSVSDLLASSKFQVSFQCGRAQRSLLHIAAKYFQFDSSFFCFNFLIFKTFCCFGIFFAVNVIVLF